MSQQPPDSESGNLFHTESPIVVNFLLLIRDNFPPSLPQTDTEPDQEPHKYEQDHEHDNTDSY